MRSSFQVRILIFKLGYKLEYLFCQESLTETRRKEAPTIVLGKFASKP